MDIVTTLLIIGGIVVLILFLATDTFDNDNDSSSIKSLNITTVPSLSPAPTGPPVPTAMPNNNAPSPAPSAAPVALRAGSSVAPTAAPSGPAAWEPIGGPYGMPSADTQYGHAVALVGNDVLAVGEPLASSNGAVEIRQGNDWTVSNGAVTTPTAARQFGSAIDQAIINGVPTIAVGAIDTAGQSVNTGLSYGSVSVFNRAQSGGAWTPVGNTNLITPSDTDAVDANGQFGFAVALATDVLRLAVASPAAPSALGNGRVDTYDYDSGTQTWQLVATAALSGSRAGTRLGHAIDLSPDGQRLIVGSPGTRGGDGAVNYYEYDPSAKSWNRKLPIPGVNGAQLGQTVKVISNDGKTIAMGEPGANNGNGAVRIFSESNFIPGFFVELGTANVGIPGETGERLGDTLCGKNGRFAVGTATGLFRAYEIVNGSQLRQLSETVNVGSAVVSMDMSQDGTRVVVGLENRQVRVFELQS